MSIANGNKYYAEEKFAQAIEEYRKVKFDSPLFAQAAQNVQRAKRELRRRSDFNLGKCLLSIIVPVFNVEPYLDACITSILYQSFQDFEVIFVNDASTDDSLAVLKMHANLDNRIKIVDLPYNTLGGAGIPSNIGLREAKGEFIAFVDSDDWMAVNALRELMLLAEFYEPDLVIADFCTFDERTREVSESYDKHVWEDIPCNVPISPTDHPSLFRLSPVPWRKIYSKKFLCEKGVQFPEGDYFYEDNPLHWQAVSSADSIVLSKKVISYHRMGRDGQTMSSAQFKLAAIASHTNTAWVQLAKNANSSSKTYSELCDYWYRNSWIVERQVQDCAKQIIKKRMAMIIERMAENFKLSSDRKNFFQRIQDWRQAYRDLDLTVVIPCFNCEEFIGETLDSVIALKGISFNVLVIDDGSTDSTLTILRTYEKKYKNIHVFEQKNRGAGRARNSLIPLCTGRYTYFLDADDIVNPTELSLAVEFAKNENADLLFFNYEIEYFDEKQRRRGMFDADRREFSKILSDPEGSKLASYLRLINYPWNRIIKTSVLHDANIFFGPTVVHNDIPFHWHTIAVSQRIRYLNRSVCIHRKFNNRQQVTNISDERRMQVFEALRFTSDILYRLKVDSDTQELWSSFRTDLLEWARKRIPADQVTTFDLNCKNVVTR